MELMELYNNNLVDIPIPEHTMPRMEWEKRTRGYGNYITIPILCIAECFLVIMERSFYASEYIFVCNGSSTTRVYHHIAGA